MGAVIFGGVLVAGSRPGPWAPGVRCCVGVGTAAVAATSARHPSEPGCHACDFGAACLGGACSLSPAGCLPRAEALPGSPWRVESQQEGHRGPSRLRALVAEERGGSGQKPLCPAARVAGRLPRQVCRPRRLCSVPARAGTSELVMLSLELVKTRLAVMSVEMRKNFVQAILTSLIEKSPDAKILRAVVKIVEEWVKNNSPMAANQVGRAEGLCFGQLVLLGCGRKSRHGFLSAPASSGAKHFFLPYVHAQDLF